MHKVSQIVVVFKGGKQPLAVVCKDLPSSYELLSHTLAKENPLPYTLIRCHYFIGNKRGKHLWTFRPG